MLDNRIEVTATYLGFLAIVTSFVWNISKEVCSALARKYWKKIDADYLTVTEFHKACHDNRMNCVVVKSFDNSIRAMKTALRILIIHTIADKKVQQDALKELDNYEID